jgi:uncharacterized glyoxalase superfamily protein PhnB
MRTVTPNLVLRDCAKAIEFYQKALGAQEISRSPAPDGSGIWHAELRIGDSVVFVNDEMPGTPQTAPTTEAPAPVTMWLYVRDCDASFHRAAAAGAKPTMPPCRHVLGRPGRGHRRPVRLSLVVCDSPVGPFDRGDASRRGGVRAVDAGGAGWMTSRVAGTS